MIMFRNSVLFLIWFNTMKKQETPRGMWKILGIAYPAMILAFLFFSFFFLPTRTQILSSNRQNFGQCINSQDMNDSNCKPIMLIHSCMVMNGLEAIESGVLEGVYRETSW